MGFAMAGQPTGENWLALVAFAVAAIDFIGLGALFVWVSDYFKRKDKR